MNRDSKDNQVILTANQDRHPQNQQIVTPCLYLSPVNAPGVVKCPALQLGHRVISKPSCTRGSSMVGTACPFECHKGFRLVGPAVKHCQMDGTWTDAALPVSCDGMCTKRTLFLMMGKIRTLMFLHLTKKYLKNLLGSSESKR